MINRSQSCELFNWVPYFWNSHMGWMIRTIYNTNIQCTVGPNIFGRPLALIPHSQANSRLQERRLY